MHHVARNRHDIYSNDYVGDVDAREAPRIVMQAKFILE